MKTLKSFIKEARNRGYDDYQIKSILLKYNWPIEEIEKTFLSLTPKYKYKNKLTIFLDSRILKTLEKRAEKNLFSLSEQIEDILRRSCLNLKPKKATEKLDDMFLALFSRKK